MHYCRGRAKEAIQECVMLPSEIGYRRARDIRKELFGQPFHVARTLIDEMLSEARRTRNEPSSLGKLAINMQNCQIALSQMNYLSDLNALHTLESVVRSLPIELQQRWADEAEQIARLDREPSFSELAEFVRTR